MENNFYKNYENEVYYVKQFINRDVEDLPPRLKDQAMKYLSSRHLLPDDPPVSGISIYLPFWLEEIYDFDNIKEICKILSIASVYLTLSVELKDSLQDETDQELSDMWLSDVFFMKGIRNYQSLFPSESNFWNYFNSHMHELYEYILWENSKPFLDIHPLSEDSLSFIGKQTSFLKPTTTALAILGSKKEHIKCFSSILENYHIGLKLVDDLFDWDNDLKNKCYTSFLSLVLRWLNKEDLNSITSDDVRLSILETDCTLKILEIAQRHTNLAKSKIRTLHCSNLSDFLNDKYLSYQAIARKIKKKQHVFEEERDSLIEILLRRNTKF